MHISPTQSHNWCKLSTLYKLQYCTVIVLWLCFTIETTPSLYYLSCVFQSPSLVHCPATLFSCLSPPIFSIPQSYYKESFFVWRWKVYDQNPHTHIPLPQNMEDTCGDLAVDAIHGWICPARQHLPCWSVACVLWPDGNRREDAVFLFCFDCNCSQ